MHILAQMIVCADQRTSSGGSGQTSTKGMWPNGEPKSVRDAYDAKQGGKK